MKFYLEEKKNYLEKKWKLLKFLEEESKKEVLSKKDVLYSGYKISRLKELFK